MSTWVTIPLGLGEQMVFDSRTQTREIVISSDVEPITHADASPRIPRITEEEIAKLDALVAESEEIERINARYDMVEYCALCFGVGAWLGLIHIVAFIHIVVN